MTFRIAGAPPFVAMLTASAAAGQTVPLYDTEEIVLRSSTSFNRIRGGAHSISTRKGTFQPAPPVQGGRIRIFNLPSADDWVLYIYK